MIHLLSFALIVVCAYSAARWSASIAGSNRRSSPWWVGVLFPLLAIALLQGAFHVLGLVELVTGRAVVSIANALVVAVAVAVLVEIVGRRRGGRSIGGSSPWADFFRSGRGAFRAGGLVSYVLLAAFLCLGVMTALQFPREFEVNAYHLPVGLHIFQEHSFRPWDTTPFHVTPATASLVFGFLLQWLPERLTSAANLFFLAALCISSYALARSIGAQGRPATIAVAGLATMPMIGFSATVLGSDVGGVAFLATALGLAFAQPFARRLNWWLAGMAIGLAYGFKMYHATSVAYVFVLALALGARGEGLHSGTMRARIEAVLLVGGGSLLTAGFWLLRGFFYFGNPTYPLSLPLVGRLFGWSGAAEASTDPAASASVWVRSPAEWLVYPWVEWHRDALGYTISAGVGPFVATALPALLVFAVIALLKREFRRPELGLLGLGIPLVLLGWWFTGQQPRYAIGALVYATPLVAYILGWLRGVARSVAQWVMGLAIAICLGILITREGVEFGDHIILARQFERADYFEYPRALDSLPDGSRIAHIGYRSGHLQLFGPRHQYRVVSYPEVMRRLGLPGPDPERPGILWPYLVPPTIEISERFVRELGVTHVYVAANTELRPGACVELKEIGALHRNPYNGMPLPAPRRLLEVALCR